MSNHNDGFVWLDEPPPRRRKPARSSATTRVAQAPKHPTPQPAAFPSPSPHGTETDTLSKAPEDTEPEHAAAPPHPFATFFYERYFRVKTQGLGFVPSHGRCLVMSNHAGGPLPFDGMMIREALRREHPRGRQLRWLNEAFIDDLPVLGKTSTRLGAIRSRLHNAEELLEKDQMVAVFPEGASGISKAFHQRNRLCDLGRSPHIEMALRTRTPVIPCAIVGAEDLGSLAYRLQHLLSGFGLPQVPLRSTPWRLGALGLLPAPTTWRLQFGEPLTLQEFTPDDANNGALVKELSQRVQQSIQTMLDDLVATGGPA